MDQTKSRHIAVPWTTESHRTRTKSNTVLLTQKVSRSEYTNPKIIASMIKELRNLNNNGTYIEVKQEPCMPIVDTIWGINNSREDDGKKAGPIKARLVIRGRQDNGVDDIRCDSPTMDRKMVKLMLAVSANKGWALRPVDISASFLQGREIDIEVYIRPLPAFKKPGIIWKQKKGLYGLKEAARLWYD